MQRLTILLCVILGCASSLERRTLGSSDEGGQEVLPRSARSPPIVTSLVVGIVKLLIRIVCILLSLLRPSAPNRTEEYIIVPLKVSWQQAQDMCEQMGLTSASFDNKEEYDKLVETIKENSEGGCANIWTCYSDLEQRDNYECPSGSKLQYTNWFKGEPNHSRNMEFCVDLLANQNYKMNDNNCAKEQCFACKSKPGLCG